MVTTIDYEKLKAPFPKDKVSWRAQTVTRDGTKCLALAYIDARDVYDRLDEVCGPDRWQCEYSQEKDRTYCRIGIMVDSGQWIWKANAAGDTAVEKEKGAASDALKRAAVAWGIGRYLYDFESIWVPCECYDQNGKKKWKRFTADPWSCVRNKSSFLPIDKPDQPMYHENVVAAAEAASMSDQASFLMGCQALVNSKDAPDLGNVFAKNLSAMEGLGEAALEQYKRVHVWMQKRHAK